MFPILFRRYSRQYGTKEYDESGGKTVMVHIRRLRKKLNDANSSHPYITTIWGVGYKMRS